MKNIIKSSIFVFILIAFLGVGINSVFAASPSVLTDVPSATSNSIILNGDYISNGTQTTTMFEYSTNQNALPSGQAGNGQIVCQTLQSSASTSGSFSCTLNVPNISIGMTYYFRAIASNVNGTNYGNVTSVQTINSPTSYCYSNTPTISSISPNSVYRGAGTTYITVYGSNFINGISLAKLNGSTRTTTVSNSNNLQITLNSSDTTSSGSNNIIITNSGCDSNIVNFSVINQSSGGGGYYGGGSYVYTPSVYTSSASYISANSFTLNGTVNSSYYSSTAWFEYGTSNYLGSYNETPHIYEGSISNLNFSQNISDLTPNTTYYFRIVANNQYGTVKGNILSFNTGNYTNTNGITTTIQATNATSTSVKLSGIFINQDGASAQGYFEYGTSSSMGSITNNSSLGNNSSAIFSSYITNLTPGTLYYFRAVATKEGITYKGKTLVFETSNQEDNNLNDNPPVDDGLSDYPPSTDNTPTVTTNQSSLIQIVTDKKEISTDDEINYLVTFKNNTSDNFKNVKITIQLPKEVDFENSNFGKETGNNNIVFDAGILVPSQVGSISIKGKINSSASAQSILVTTAIMSYNTSFSNNEKDEIAYITNSVLGGGTGLEANSIFGKNFLPSSLLGWSALVLVILFLVSINRKLYAKKYAYEKKYGEADHINNLPTH